MNVLPEPVAIRTSARGSSAPATTMDETKNPYTRPYILKVESPYLAAMQKDTGFPERPGQDSDRTLAARLAGLYGHRSLLTVPG